MRLILLTTISLIHLNAIANEPFCPNEPDANPNVIFCDSFEPENGNRNAFTDNYFFFDNDEGDFKAVTDESVHGTTSLQAKWQKGEIEAGSMQVHFGRSPLRTNIRPNENFREVYWRYYLKLESDFEDYPDKMGRLTIFAKANWSQAMIAHVWAASDERNKVVIDPASGIKNNQLSTTKWNDFANLSWLGLVKSQSNFPKGEWVCIEAHVKLNDRNQSNGIFELSINEKLEASKYNLNWVGNWSEYGINAMHFSNYWNAGSPKEGQKRYLDALVISTAPIGCRNTLRPEKPTDVRVE